MSIQVEALRKFIGKPAKDTYGRYIGYVIGISFDAMGQLNSIGVDQGSGSFEEYPNSQILIDNETLVVIPDWKVETENFRKDNSLTQRRFQALDDLLRNEEIPNYVYDDLCRQYKESMKRLEETNKVLVTSLTKRAEDLDRDVRNLEKFLGNLKVQYKAGEMSEETFSTASEYLTSGINRSLREKKDILNSLNTLTSSVKSLEGKPKEPSSLPLEEEAKVSPALPEQPEEAKSSKPIVVRLRSDEA